MPHADSSLVPSTITSKSEFWAHVYTQLDILLSGQRYWITNLANASSLIYSSLLAFPSHFGTGSRAVNWSGFYLQSSLFPDAHIVKRDGPKDKYSVDHLLLGPFCGKPACQFIKVARGSARGVCADAYLSGKTVLVPEVDLYPGHIACDAETKSEIVCPLVLKIDSREIVLGVLDLDCLAVSGFDEEDREGLEKIAALIVNACDW